MANGFEVVLKLCTLNNNRVMIIPGEVDFIISTSVWIKLASKSPAESSSIETVIHRERFTHACFLYTTAQRGQFNRTLLNNMHTGCHTCIASYPFWKRPREEGDYRMILQIVNRQTTGPLREIRPVEDNLQPLTAEIRTLIDPYLPLDLSIRNIINNGSLNQVIQTHRQRTRNNDIRSRQLENIALTNAPLHNIRMAPYPRRVARPNPRGTQTTEADSNVIQNLSTTQQQLQHLTDNNNNNMAATNAVQTDTNNIAQNATRA